MRWTSIPITTVSTIIDYFSLVATQEDRNSTGVSATATGAVCDKITDEEGHGMANLWLCMEAPDLKPADSYHNIDEIYSITE